MKSHDYDRSKDVIQLYDDQLYPLREYEWWTAHAKAVGKPITTQKRPEKRPPNALVVIKSELMGIQNYLAITERAKREGKVVWVVDDPPDPEKYLVAQKRDVPDPESYARWQERAAAENKTLWVVADEEE